MSDSILNRFLSEAPANKTMAKAQDVLRSYLREAVEKAAGAEGALTCPEDIANLLRSFLMPEDFMQEVFGVVGFDVGQKVTVAKIVFRGGVSETPADPKVIFRTLLMTEKASSRFAIFHTHPSGNTSPSEADIYLTERMVKLGREMNIQCIDHLIMTREEHCSLADFYPSSF